MKRQPLVHILGLLVMVIAAVSSEVKPDDQRLDMPMMKMRNEQIRYSLRKHRKNRNRKGRKMKLPNPESAPPSVDKEVVAGIKNIAKIIEEGRSLFQHGKFDVKSERIPYHAGLAAQYGTLTSGTIKAMDEKLKVTIASTNRLMKMLQKNVDNINSEIPFEDYVGVMNQNVMIKMKDGSEIIKSDVLTFEDMNWFKIDGSPDKKKVMQVQTWFTNLINDTDVLKDTRIDIEDLANIVAASGAAVTDFKTLFYAKEYIERSIVDVGILRYPDPVNPFFKLFRIKIFAYRKATRILIGQKDESGIKGDYECVQFVPRNKILRQMRKEVISKAVLEAESMFD